MSSVLKGERIILPAEASKEVIDLVADMLVEEPDDRPSIKDIQKRINWWETDKEE